MNYRMIVQYDGSHFEGWQKQVRTKNTIQGKLEKALGVITGETVQVIGAGRTDAGVHAAGQVANFRLQHILPSVEIEKKLNDALPDAIGVIHVREADDHFHSRFSATEKTYCYRIRVGSTKNVFERRYIWQYGKALNVQAMRKAAKALTGTHDFTSFCSNKKLKNSAERTLFSISFREKQGELAIEYKGDGFLQGMVRILTGTLVEVGEGKKKPEDMAGIFDARNRAAAGFTAPPEGLTLASVEYGKDGYAEER